MARIIVVEDDTVLRGMIAEELQDLGHTVKVASDGEAALQMIQADKPDVICCDVNMPRMNGFQLKAKLQDDSAAAKKTLFVFISANTSKNDIADGLMLGADHYFTKPIDFDRLAKVINSV